MKRLLVLSLTICLSSSAFALNWQMVGARSMAMGGAGVVTASGTNAQYYNVALLGEVPGDEKTDENGFHLGIQIETPKIGPADGTAGSSGISYIKELLAKGYVPYTNMDVGFGVRRGNFAFSIRSLDVVSFTHNADKALIDSAAFTEAALGYGFYLVRGVRLGGNVKVIQGTTMEKNFDLSSNVGIGSLMKHSWNHKKLSADWGIDLGASINFSELFNGNFIFNPDIGITAKNLNTPTFKRPDRPNMAPNLPWNTDKYELKPQYRAGAAIHPFTNRLTIAADLDLNKNETSIKGIEYKSRQLSLGAEAIVWNDHTFQVPLRVGMNKNLAEDDAPTYITAGFGVLDHDFDFELGLAVGDRTERIKKYDIPNALGLSMTFAWYF